MADMHIRTRLENVFYRRYKKPALMEKHSGESLLLELEDGKIKGTFFSTHLEALGAALDKYDMTKYLDDPPYAIIPIDIRKPIKQ